MAVFLSYAREDSQRVTELRGELDELRGPVWFDQRLVGGQDWWDEILRQIRGCELLALAVSGDSVRSAACLAEVHYALAVARPVIGVLLEPIELAGVDEAIRSRHLVDFHARDVDSVRKLARAVLMVGATPPLPEPLPPLPPPPASYADRFSAVFAQRLNLDQQLALFAQLRFDIESDDHVERATALLGQLYERPDISWRVRKDIEEFRDRQLAVPPPPQLGSALLRKKARRRVVKVVSPSGTFVLEYSDNYYTAIGDIVVQIDVDGQEAYRGSWTDDEAVTFAHPTLGDAMSIEVRCAYKGSVWVKPIVAFDIQVNGVSVYHERAGS